MVTVRAPPVSWASKSTPGMVPLMASWGFQTMAGRVVMTVPAVEAQPPLTTSVHSMSRRRSAAGRDVGAAGVNGGSYGPRRPGPGGRRR